MKLSMWYISNLGCYSLTSQASNYNMHSDNNWPQGYGTGSFRLDSDLIFLRGLEKTSRKFLREMLVGLIRWGEKGKNGGWWKVGGEGEYVECRESLKEAGHIWNRGKVTHILVGSWHLYIPGKDLEKKVTQGDGKFSNFFLETVYHLVVVQPLSHVRLFATPWTAAHQAFLSFTISQSFLKLTSIESVMPSNRLVLCHPLLLLPSIFPSIRVFYHLGN